MHVAIRRILPLVSFVLLAACSAGENTPGTSAPATADHPELTRDAASRFATLALDCMHREYPNKLNQVLKDETGLLPPTALHPAFYGCFDWHSAVHGHWMLVKILKQFPDLPERTKIVEGLSRSLTLSNIAGEIGYFESASPSWERTYGWAWLLQLATELTQWDDPLGREWAETLSPLSRLIRDRYIEFLPRQEYPIRTGVHPNTAFGLSFAYDYARAVGDAGLTSAIENAARRYYLSDSDCPLSWEPSGEDFLSPCFEEAALMARVMPGADFKRWLSAFLPSLDDPSSLVPANVSDRSDPKIVHLDGLNLSRAWNLTIIANELDDEAQVSRLRDTASSHLAATLPHVSGEHYEGSHWLGSFAIYALTRKP